MQWALSLRSGLLAASRRSKDANSRRFNALDVASAPHRDGEYHTGEEYALSWIVGGTRSGKGTLKKTES